MLSQITISTLPSGFFEPSSHGEKWLYGAAVVAHIQRAVFAALLCAAFIFFRT